MSARNKSATKSYWTADAKVAQTEIALSIPNQVALAAISESSFGLLTRGIRGMSQFLRKPVESAYGYSTNHTSSAPPDLANEKHYSIIEISRLWALSQKTVRKIFENEPGVILYGRAETMRKRGYRTLRVPETILQRVHRRLRHTS